MSLHTTGLPYVLDYDRLRSTQFMFEVSRNQFEPINATRLLKDKIHSGTHDNVSLGVIGNRRTGDEYRVTARDEGAVAVFDLCASFHSWGVPLHSRIFFYSIEFDVPGVPPSWNAFAVEDEEIRVLRLPEHSLAAFKQLEATNDCIGFSRWAFRKFYLTTKAGQIACLTPGIQIHHLDKNMVFPEVIRNPGESS